MAEPAMLDAAAPTNGAVDVVLGCEGAEPDECAEPVPDGYRAAVVWVPFETAYWAVAVLAMAAAAARVKRENCILWFGGW
jgi:hypothetical protein